jgi:thioredoxin reductase (NADPH)
MTTSGESDVLIVGAGPAGISAAQWLHTYDVSFDWVSQDGRIGGILHRVENPIENYPAADFDDGRELADALARQVEDAAYEPPRVSTVRAIQRTQDGLDVEFEDQKPRRYRRLLLATGTRFRRLGIPGEEAGLGDCVSQSTSADAERFAGREVAIVGGGDAGFEGALQLAETGSRVHMLLRSEEYRARPQFVDPVEAHPEIEIHPIPSVVKRIEPLDPDGCTLHVDVQGESTRLDVACLFVRIGVEPTFPPCSPSLATTDAGYIDVDGDHRTSVDGLFAAGEVVGPRLPAVATAVGDGADAAHVIADTLGHL